MAALLIVILLLLLLLLLLGILLLLPPLLLIPPAPQGGEPGLRGCSPAGESAGVPSQTARRGQIDGGTYLLVHIKLIKRDIFSDLCY